MDDDMASMNIKWKKGKIKPSVILKKIDEIKTVKEQGDTKSVSYSGFEYHDAMATLSSMVNFPKKTNGLFHEQIISSAVNNVAKVSDLSEDAVLYEMKRICTEKLSIKVSAYYILTSISTDPSFPIKSATLEGASIRIHKNSYPKKFKGRGDAIKASNYKKNEAHNSDYAKITICLNARSTKEAATKALRVLDIERAIWCLFANHGMQLFGGDEWHPINRIRLGKIHTVHKEDFKAVSDIIWHEPNFVKQKLFFPEDPELFVNNVKWVNRRLKLANYSDKLKEALIRFVRALDERDQNVALIKLWGAMESLTLPDYGNYDSVTQRTSFLFEERDYHRQVLEHLREYRNQSVHAGDQNENAKTYCYQLKFYFFRLMLFHLRNSLGFSSLDEANKFLDSSRDLNELKQQQTLIRKAIKFSTPRE